VLDELRERLPFLRDYGLSPKEFAVSDLRYVHLQSQPIVALSSFNVIIVIRGPKMVFRLSGLGPHHANQAFVDLCGYTRVCVWSICHERRRGDDH
jgi:hypothetical protein